MTTPTRPTLKKPAKPAASPYRGKGKGSNPNSIANLRPHRPGEPWFVPPRKEPLPGAMARVREMAAQGVPESLIAEMACGMHVSTWTRWKRDHPEWAEALALGRDEMKGKLVGKLYAKAMSDTDPNPATLIFACKALAGLRERDGPEDQRPVVNITLPGAAASLEDFRRMITIEHEPALLSHDADHVDD